MDRDVDADVPAGSPVPPQRLILGAGEITTLVTQDMSAAHDLLTTILPAGAMPAWQAPGRFRAAHVDPLLTVRGNLEEPLRLAGVDVVSARQQVLAVAALLDLTGSLDTRAMALPPDQRERVRAAMEAIKPAPLVTPHSFARMPEDEATELRAKVLELRRILGRSTLLLEDRYDVGTGADRVAVADHEAVRQVGSPEEVYERPVDLYTAARFGRHSLMLADAQSAGRDLVTPAGRIILPRGISGLGARRLLIGLRPGALSAGPGYPHGQLELAMRVAGAPGAGQPTELDQDWSPSFALPAAALRAGLAPRVAGVRLPGNAVVGEQVRLTADPGRIMLFDATTGENVLGDRTLGDLGAVTVAQAPPTVVIRRGPGGPESVVPAGEPPPAGLVRRFLNCDHPPSVQRGSDFIIRVQVTVEKGAGGHAFDTDPIPPGGAELIFVLYASRFVPRTNATITSRLPPNGDSKPGVFVLTAPARTGRYQLLLRLFRGSAQLAEQSLTVEVTEKPTAPNDEPSAWPLADVTPQPHLVRLIIARAGKQYQYVLASDDPTVPSVYASKPLSLSPGRKLADLVSHLSEMAAGGGAPSEIRETLRSEGQELWHSFVPDELADGLQALDPARNILWISTFGEIEKVPWEMLHPVEEIGGRSEFLAQLFPVVRSPAGAAGSLDKFAIRRVEMVLSDRTMEEATAEVSAIRRILAGRADVGDEISEKAKLRQVLGGGEFSVLHVAGHNASGKGSGLALARGQRLRPLDLNGLAARGGRWAAARPLVFLNACGTDRPERTYTGLTDWAQKCFDAGAGAFVGSLWDVRSKPARAFATCFYRALLEDGQPLALAAHLARNEAWQQSSKDPTWLAYTVYGNPFARAVSAGVSPPGDVPLPQ